MTFDEYENYCLEFYYYLHGLYPATLNVYLKQDGKLGLPVWTKSYTQQKGWMRGELKITGVKYPTFQVSFEASNPYAVYSVSSNRIINC